MQNTEAITEYPMTALIRILPEIVLLVQSCATVSPLCLKTTLFLPFFNGNGRSIVISGQIASTLSILPPISGM